MFLTLLQWKHRGRRLFKNRVTVVLDPTMLLGGYWLLSACLSGLRRFFASWLDTWGTFLLMIFKVMLPFAFLALIGLIYLGVK